MMEKNSETNCQPSTLNSVFLPDLFVRGGSCRSSEPNKPSSSKAEMMEEDDSETTCSSSSSTLNGSSDEIDGFAKIGVEDVGDPDSWKDDDNTSLDESSSIISDLSDCLECDLISDDDSEGLEDGSDDECIEEYVSITKKEPEDQAMDCTEEGNESDPDTSEIPPKIAKLKLTPSKRRTAIECKTTTFNAIARLFAYTGNMPIEFLRKNVVTTPQKSFQSTDLNKTIKWLKTSAPELFWGPLARKGIVGLDEWKAFELVHQATINCAFKFMTVVERLLRPDEIVHHGKHGFNGFEMLHNLVRGILLTSEARKEVSSEVVKDLFDKFYTCGFKAVVVRNGTREGETSSICKTCENVSCVCDKTATLFMEANMALHGLGLVPELAGPRLYSVIRKQIKDRVMECNLLKIDVSYYHDLVDWLQRHMAPWIETIYPLAGTGYANKQGKDIFSEFRSMLLEVYGKCIVENMFSIMIEFPDSQPILQDLRVCMKAVNLRNHLVSNLKRDLERRLLNAGVNTSDVLDAYVSCVNALKYLDPSGILVQLVTPPVRDYLKLREETVRVILVSLTDESGDLAEELSRHPVSSEKKNRLAVSDWEDWKPDPIDVPRDIQNLRKSDLIQALISIYGTKTVFINEYRSLLAERLLKMRKPASITREIRCLELLKLRFGDSDLQKCEVMLKDVSDSMRMNTRFYEEEGAVLANEEIPLTALIVSEQFWPLFKNETITYPPVMQEAVEKYTKAFEAMKGNRTLQWQKHIGVVELEVELGGTVQTFSVSPTHATLLWHFQTKGSWTVQELEEVTNMSGTSIKNRLELWISKGVLKHVESDTFSLVAEFDQSGGSSNRYVEEIESDSLIPSSSAQKESELQRFWSYIEGMLTNLESLTLQRIHSMLKLFATVECSVDELQKFLDEKVQNNLLVFTGGQYQLAK